MEGGSWDEETRDSGLLSPGGCVQWLFLRNREGRGGGGKRRGEDKIMGEQHINNLLSRLTPLSLLTSAVCVQLPVVPTVCAAAPRPHPLQEHR